MNHRPSRLLPLFALFLCPWLVPPPAAATEGFYKDAFMDGGTGLTHRVRLYAAESLGLSYEYLAREDTSLLRHIMIANPDDANGCLLYPDGAPRFRLIYTNGGDAYVHGTALGEAGRQRVRDFYSGGGSYSGSCAGAYLASLSNQDSGVSPFFYHIWPGRTKDTRIQNAHVGNFIPHDSPLLQYDSFGGDFYIDSLFVYNGPLANESIDWPQNTEVLLRYDTAGYFCHNKVACWAHKAADTTGRAVLLGSHPEGWFYGEWLHLTEAVFRYALDGLAAPRPKAELASGVTRHMDQSTGGDPGFARIGDRQYHHFTCDVPAGCQGLAASIAADDSFQVNLYLSHSGIAFRSTADYIDTSPGSHKTIVVPQPASGPWYIGVELATTVTTYGDSCFLYSGPTQVLNGIAYDITATWDTTGAIAEQRSAPWASRPTLSVSPNPCNSGFAVLRFSSLVTRHSPSSLAIFDASGRLVLHSTLDIGHSTFALDLRSMSAGVYVVRLSVGGLTATQKLILQR